MTEKTITQHNTYEYLTVRQLIHLLLDTENLDWEVYIKDKDGNRMHGASIMAKEGQGLGALFG